jgi:hypothetical protein
MQKKTLSIVLALLILGAGFFFFGMQKKEKNLPPVFEESSSSTLETQTTSEPTSTTIISPKPQTIEISVPKPKKEYANPTDACIGEYLEKGETDVNKILSMCLGISQ